MGEKSMTSTANDPHVLSVGNPFRLWCVKRARFPKHLNSHKAFVLSSTVFLTAICFRAATSAFDAICLYILNVQRWKSVLWETIISVIVSKICICTCVLSRTVSEIELFHYTSNTLCRHTSWKVHWCWQWNFRKCIIQGKVY
jgi:hypothetical protein